MPTENPYESPQSEKEKIPKRPFEWKFALLMVFLVLMFPIVMLLIFGKGSH